MTSSAGLQANTRRFELYVRISLYVLLAGEPAAVLGAVAPGHRLLAGLLAVLHLATNIGVCHWALSSARVRRVRLDRRSIGCGIGWLILSAATTSVAVANVGAITSLGIVSVFTAGTTACALAPALRPVWVLVLGPAAAVASVLAVIGFGVADTPTALGLGVGLLFGLTLFVFTFWLSKWMLAVVWELDAARRTAAELATAEERLRIARDLHDLYGRTLATVAVKSELAAELIRRGRPEDAADEIGSVRVIADQSGREMRQLVQGYREADLAAELAGARALLDSAGIRCVVEGVVPAGLDRAVTTALGWTLREAVTNVIRHSRARECFIRVTLDEEVRLSVTNDGTPTTPTAATAGADRSGPRGAGSGLVGMQERLAAVDGRLEHWLSGDRFTVEAVVPVRLPATGRRAR